MYEESMDDRPKTETPYKRMSEVPDRVSIEQLTAQMTNSITDLQDAIERMIMRIDPVLVPSNSATAGRMTDDQDVPEHSALATYLNKRNVEIRDLIYKVGETTERIEL